MISGNDISYSVIIGRTTNKSMKEVDEVPECIWSVADVIYSLGDISKEIRVYTAGDGYYFAIDGLFRLHTID